MIENHFIQEKIILPISDLATGQSVGKYLKFLQKSNHWSRSEIDNFQNQRLRILITYAYENVPFYRDQFKSLNLSPLDIQTKADLIKLPVISKAILKKEGMERFTSTQYPKNKTKKRASERVHWRTASLPVDRRGLFLEPGCHLARMVRYGVPTW